MRCHLYILWNFPIVRHTGHFLFIVFTHTPQTDRWKHFRLTNSNSLSRQTLHNNTSGVGVFLRLCRCGFWLCICFCCTFVDRTSVQSKSESGNGLISLLLTFIVLSLDVVLFWVESTWLWLRLTLHSCTVRPSIQPFVLLNDVLTLGDITFSRAGAGYLGSEKSKSESKC
jgi:hypothetical protein